MIIDSQENLNVVQGVPVDSDLVFVVAFRNQEEKILRCLNSIVKNHAEENFGLILIDDNSEDNSFQICKEFLSRATFQNVFVRNRERRYYTRNLFNAVNLLITKSDAIVVEVDGDDYLENKNIIEIIRRRYDNGVLQTFGSFRLHADPKTDREIALSKSCQKNNSADPWNFDECAPWLHLKTYKKHLFMSVPLNYFFEKETKQWLQMAEDICIHPKMMELAQGKIGFIEEIIYVYDTSGECHDTLEKTHPNYVINKLYQCPKGAYFKRLARIDFLNKSLKSAQISTSS